MPRHDELARAAGAIRKVLVFGSVPKFDQLTEYVYESSVIVSGNELRMQLTVGTVIPDKSMPADWIAEDVL